MATSGQAFVVSVLQDYVYAFRPLQGVTVNASLCNSYFDTKLVLFMESSTGGTPTLVACNDDGCNSQSWLQVTLFHKSYCEWNYM